MMSTVGSLCRLRTLFLGGTVAANGTGRQVVKLMLAAASHRNRLVTVAKLFLDPRSVAERVSFLVLRAGSKAKISAD